MLDAKLAELVAGHDEWSARSRWLRSVPGVGLVLAQTLIALLPELASLGTRCRQSGGACPVRPRQWQYAGERHIQGGHMAIRNVLFMATLSARSCNPLIAAFAERLAACRAVITASIQAGQHTPASPTVFRRMDTSNQGS